MAVIVKIIVWYNAAKYLGMYVCRYYKDIDFQYFSIQRHPMCQNIVARKMLNCSSQWPGYPVQVSGTNLH